MSDKHPTRHLGTHDIDHEPIRVWYRDGVLYFRVKYSRTTKCASIQAILELAHELPKEPVETEPLPMFPTL